MLLHVFREAINLADHFQANVVFVQLRSLAFQIVDEIFHQRIHFILGSIPILRRKRVKRQVFDAEFSCGPDDDPCGFRPRPMPLHARQMPLLGPTPIAIHDHGHVLRQVSLGFAGEMRWGAHAQLNKT